MIKALVIGDRTAADPLQARCGDAHISTISVDGLQDALLPDNDPPDVIVLEGGHLHALQQIAASDRDLSVIVLAPRDEVPTLRQRIVFLPFRLTEVKVLDRDELDKVVDVIRDQATRTKQRRAFKELQTSLSHFKPGGISSVHVRDSFMGHFMDEAATGAILLNAREEVIYLNKKVRELLPGLKIAPPNTFFDHFPPEYASELRVSINKPYSAEPFSVRLGAGEEVHLKFKLTSQNDLQGSGYHIIIIYDVTDSVVQARMLEERIKEKNEFIAVLSHDLKNPISGLVLSAQTLAESIDELSREDVQTLANVIDNSSKQLLQQFDQLVEWARSRQELSFKPEPLKLCRRSDDALKLVKDLARQKHIGIHNETRSDAVVMADPHMVRSIFQNLVTNAIKFSPEGATITISSKADGPMEEICVKDEGVGMSEEVRQKILNNESTTTAGTRAEPGTGLGLILVKEFIARHHGRFSIKTDQGKGTVICFTLPRHTQDVF